MNPMSEHYTTTYLHLQKFSLTYWWECTGAGEYFE